MSFRSVASMHCLKCRLPVVYDGKKLADVGYRVDLLVENELIVEVKSVEAVAPVHTAQLFSYLRLSKPAGWNLSAGESVMKDERKRR